MSVRHIIMDCRYNLMHFRVTRMWLWVAAKTISRDMVHRVTIMEGADVRAFREVHTMTDALLVFKCVMENCLLFQDRILIKRRDG